MVSRRYSAAGRYLGSNKSQKDIDQENTLQNFVVKACVILAIICATFAPLLLVSLAIFGIIHQQQYLHELIAGLVAAVPTVLGIYLIYISKFVRCVYFGTISATIVGIIVVVVRNNSDAIWATFAGLIACFFGVIVTRFAANYRLVAHREQDL